MATAKKPEKKETKPTKTAKPVAKKETKPAKATAKAPEKKTAAKPVKPAAKKVEPKAVVHKDYHISQREDGKWQVKGAKAEKALKIFDTQAEAIKFAKTTAGNQEGTFTIHKKDGKIRKQTY